MHLTARFQNYWTFSSEYAQLDVVSSVFLKAQYI